MRLQRISALTLFVLLLAAATAWAAIPDRPAQDIYVQDYAGLLSQETKDRILAIGHELDEKTTAQIAVVTVKTLDDRPIADYANELFRSWGIGDKDKNNGVLLLISQDPRKLRIEVGYGLEGAMPDGWTGQVRDEQLTPYLKKDDYDTGVMKAYEVLAAKAANDAGQTLDTVSQEAREAAADPPDSPIVDVLVYAFLGLLGIAAAGGIGLFIYLFFFYKPPKEPETNRHHHRRHHHDDGWFGGGGGSSGGGDFFGGGDSGGGGSEGDY